MISRKRVMHSDKRSGLALIGEPAFALIRVLDFV